MHLDKAGAEAGTDFVIRTLSPFVASTSLPTLTGKKIRPFYDQFSCKLQAKDIGPIGYCAHS